MANMSKRAVLAGLGALATTAAAPAPTPVRVALQTALGPITLELAADKAPLTCANFLRYVDAARLDGAAFYRSVRIVGATDTGLIQGGVRGDPARLYPPIAHESTLQTGLSHKDGVISLARYAPGSATCEFFICVGDQPYLDADPAAPGDSLGFAAFGRVVDGADTVRRIHAAPTSATLGEGVMKGQMLDPVVTIVSARRTG